jgi:hypothetical protein
MTKKPTALQNAEDHLDAITGNLPAVIEPASEPEPEIPDQTELVIDYKALDADAIKGARAYTQLLNRAGKSWQLWEATIVGLRALRDLAFAKAHTSDISSWHYRQELSALLELKKYGVYGNIDKQTRSSCYKLMDRLPEISAWYATLPTADKLKWTHPDTIVKHAPAHLIEGGKGGNMKTVKAAETAAKRKYKAAVPPEVARLRQLLIKVIQRLIAFDPTAADLLALVDPEDPADSLDDI